MQKFLTTFQQYYDVIAMIYEKNILFVISTSYRDKHVIKMLFIADLQPLVFKKTFSVQCVHNHYSDHVQTTLIAV